MNDSHEIEGGGSKFNSETQGQNISGKPYWVDMKIYIKGIEICGFI